MYNKCVSLHFKAPVSRGREQQPRKSLSFSTPADLRSSYQTKTLSFNIPHTNSLPVTAASSQAKHTQAMETTPAATNKSTTLFNAVATRSADVTFSPNMFTDHHFKAGTFETTSPFLSHSSNFPFATMATSQAKSTSSSGANTTISPKLTKKIISIPDISDAKHTVSIPLTLSTTTSDVLICSDTNPKTTASDTTASSVSTAPEANHFNMPSKWDGAAPAYDRLAFSASCTQSPQCSTERSNKSARNSTAALKKTKTPRPKPGKAHIHYL